MRSTVFRWVVFIALLAPRMSGAQAYQFRTPPPAATAEASSWQINDDSILVAGLVYYPTRETRFFDAQIMARIDTYQSVPVYSDVTLEPYSVIYVPIGRGLVRGYERRRNRELAGTEGSRVSAFPIESSSAPLREEPVIGTAAVPPPVPASESSPGAASATRPAPTRMESIPAPRGRNGIWLEFNGSRWYSAGASVEYSPDRFIRIGEYHEFPVYREKSGPATKIWVSLANGRLLAPYARR